MIKQLIINNINFKKSKFCYSAKRDHTPVNNDCNTSVIIKFKLSIPMWVNDKEIIKDDSMSIIYAKNKKSRCNQYVVNLKNVDSGYPNVGNNKYLVIERKYDILDWVKTGCNYHFILGKDREEIFREIRSNIILQEIGDLTKKWNDITDGKFNDGYKVPYSSTKYNVTVDQLANWQNWGPDPEKYEYKKCDIEAF